MFAVLGPLLFAALSVEPAPELSAPTRPVREAVAVTAGATCLERDRLVSAVIPYLSDPRVDARVAVTVVGDPDREFAAQYEVVRRKETIAVRTFETQPTDCEQFHQVLGVSIALAIDATVVSEPEPEPPPPVVEPEPEPQPVVASKPKPEPESKPKPEPSDWELRLAVGGGLLVDAPPRWGGGGALGIEAGWRDAIDIQLGAFAGASAATAAGRGTARLSVAAGRLDVCGGFRWRVLRPRACAGVLVGAASAAGQGFSDDRVSRVPWIAAPIGGDLRVDVSQVVAFELGLDAIVHIARPAFDFFDERGVRRLGREFPRVGAGVFGGLVVRLGGR